jgi:hypothetical protein
VGHSKGHAKGKFIAISAYIKKKKERATSPINNLMMHLKLLGKTRTNQTQIQQKERNNKDQVQDQ